MMVLPPLPPSFVRRVAYPAYRALRRDRVLEVLGGLERDQWLGRAELEELQWRRLKSLLERITEHVPYYRGLFAGLGLHAGDIRDWGDFRRLPFLTKEIIRAERERLVTRDESVRGEASSTGGSTGDPLYFYIDRAAGPLRRANGFRVGRWLGIDIGDRQAVLWGIHLGQSLRERIAEGVRNYLGNIMYLSSFDMSERAMKEYANRLHRYGPQLIIGYPSALAHLAEYCRRVQTPPIRPKAVITSGERIFPAQRESIEDVFASPVYDRYGCREFSGIAQQCGERGGLHLFADLLCVEVIHESGRAARSGEMGEVVVTDLFNFYMPFVRYRTGDLAVASERTCACGRGLPLIESVEGRAFDVVVTPGGKSVGGFFWTWLSRSVPGILRYQIEQRSRSGIIVRIVPGPDWKQEYAAGLESRIKENCGQDFSVRFEMVDEIPLTKAGKFRFIISNIE
jgi:phenylacetate-CoA ligase